METLSRVLVMEFNNNKGGTVSIRINNPSDFLEASEIKAAMDTVVAQNVIGDEIFEITSVKSAYYLQVQEQAVEMN